MIVRDPSAGYGVKVNSQGMGYVEARTLPFAHETNISQKNSYVMELPAVILGSNWIWAAIKNTDDSDMVIERCVLWTSTSKSNDWVSAYTRGAFTYAANGTAATPSCCNSGGALSASGSFYYNDAVGDMTTITAGQSCGSILVINTPLEFRLSSGWVVPKNQTWYLKSELANDNTYRGWIEFYYHSV